MYNNSDLNIISDGIAILILTVIGFSLENILKASKELELLPLKLSKSLVLYVAGLIIVEKDATCPKMAEKLGSVSHDKLSRVLTEGGEVLVSKISIIFINFCLSQTGEGFLILDDVLVPKRYSQNIGGVYNEYDHIDKERLKGMRIVMLIWSDGKLRIPVAWAIWHKEDKTLIGFTPKRKPKYQHTGNCLLKINGQTLPYKTKNKIGLELLTKAVKKGLNPKYFTFDSWYAGKKNLTAIRLLSLTCYSRLKSNRTVIYQGEKITVKELGKRIPKNSFNYKHDAYIKAEKVCLPGFGDIKLLFVRKDKHPEPGETKYMFSTDINVSAPQLLLRYRSRWLIETMFRDIKQNCNLGACQARSLTNQEAHIALVLLSFVIIDLEPVMHFNSETAETVGEKKRLLSSLLLMKQQGKQIIIDVRQTDSKSIPMEDSFLGRVSSALDSASESLNYKRN